MRRNWWEVWTGRAPARKGASLEQFAGGVRAIVSAACCEGARLCRLHAHGPVNTRCSPSILRTDRSCAYRGGFSGVKYMARGRHVWSLFACGKHIRSVVGRLFTIVLFCMILLFVLVAVLRIWEEWGAREATRRSICANNLKYIGVAMQGYYDSHNTFPASRYDAPNMRSWRTAILPFLGQDEVHDQYASGGWMEPWDSPAHQPVSKVGISTYRCPSDEALPENGTSYVMVVGQGMMGEVGAELTFQDVKDGTPYTIFVVEWPHSGIPWAKPDDIGAEQFLSLFGNENAKGNHAGGVYVLMCDGAARFLPFTVERETVHAMLTYAGGEQVELPWD